MAPQSVSALIVLAVSPRVRRASIAAVALFFLTLVLVPALLALHARDAAAQVRGGDCFPPANSVYSGGAGLEATCGSLDPGLVHVACSFYFQGSASCSPLPASVPGAAVDIPLDGVINFTNELSGGGEPSCGPFDETVPVSTNLHVSFNHEAGATRYFDIAVDAFEVDGYCVGSVTPGSGEVTVEDLGGGSFLFDSHIDVGVWENICSTSETGQVTLTPSLVGVPPGRAPLSLTLAPTIPSPVRSRASIRFSLPSEGPVALVVYDLSGREVAVLLDERAMPAGPHELSLDTQGWRPGCYYYRLTVPGASRTQMMVALR